MLFAGWEVRIVKNCNLGLKKHFQARGHRFSLYGPTLSQQITHLFFPAIKLGYKCRVCLRNFVIESAYEPFTNHSQKI